MAYRELRINLKEYMRVEEYPLIQGTTSWNTYIRKKLREAGFKFSKDDRPWATWEEPILQKPWCVEEEVATGFNSFIRIRQWDRNEEVPWYSQDRKEMLLWNILQRSRELSSSLRSLFAHFYSSLHAWLRTVFEKCKKLGKWLR